MKLFENVAYVIWHNRIRLLLLFGVVTAWIFLAGSVREVFAGIIEFIGSLPGLVIYLAFILFVGIFQFVGIMWFLSRPRTYTVTPDDPQIGLSFENYRGQPDLVAHAKSLVRI